MTTERELIANMVAVIADAHDDCLDGMHRSAREMLMGLIQAGNAYLQQAAKADANATDYIGDGSPSALAAGLRQWSEYVPSHARQLLVAAADALVAPVAPVDALAMQYLALTDAMGYDSGDDGVQWSPEEWAADLVKRANAAAPVAPAAHDDAMPASPIERHLRRLLAARVGIPHYYHDDGEASGSEHGIQIDFMRDPVSDIEAKLYALNVARMKAAPVAPALVPLTDEQIEACLGEADKASAQMRRTHWNVHFTRAIEAAHGIGVDK